MKKVIKLTESELKQHIQKIIQEQGTDIERLKRERDRLKKELANIESQIGSIPNVGGKRPHDKMVRDCLKSKGFVTNDTSGKYEFSMSKKETGQSGTMKLFYLIRSLGDPTTFDTYVLIDGKLNSNGFLKIDTTTNCDTIVDTVYGRINVKYNYRNGKPIY